MPFRYGLRTDLDKTGPNRDNCLIRRWAGEAGMSSDASEPEDDFDDLQEATDLAAVGPAELAEEVLAEFDENDFDEEFDDDFEEEIEGEYGLEHDKYGEEFRAEFGHLEVKDDEPGDGKKKKT